MSIPVCYISQYGRIIGTCDFDGTKFIDNKSTSILNRKLPVQDYISCEIIDESNICTVVGRDNKEYIVCFGDNALYRVDRETLSKYNVSNAIIKNGKLFITDKVEDLGYRFPDKKIVFNAKFKEIKQSSIGIARKFYGKYNKRYCVVKFSKQSNNRDIQNEIKYYEIASILGVKCCRVVYSRYDNKDCCISFFEYDKNKDVFSSFKKLNKPIEQIYKSLSKDEKIEFDKMMILEYILSQQDRHYSNIALLNDKMYPLFDNGECLGVGSIGFFSENYRKYVRRLDRNYIKQIIDFSKLHQIKNILNPDEVKLVQSNIKELQI